MELCLSGHYVCAAHPPSLINLKRGEVTSEYGTYAANVNHGVAQHPIAQVIQSDVSKIQELATHGPPVLMEKTLDAALGGSAALSRILKNLG